MKSNIEYKNGNLFLSGCQTLVTGVNGVGVTDATTVKGLTKCKPTVDYSPMFLKYKEYCSMGLMVGGKLWLYRPEGGGHWVLNFPTTDKGGVANAYKSIDAGLRKFVDTYEEKGITSAAFPLLGTYGENPLDKNRILAMLVTHLRKTNIPIEIYDNEIIQVETNDNTMKK